MSEGSKAMLWLCLYLPDLALDVLQRGGNANLPAAVHENHGRRHHIVTVNHVARQLGISAGMAVETATALAPALTLRPREPLMERRTLSRLAAWAGQFSDCISLAPPQRILLEAGGSLRLFGGARALLEQVRDGAIALGYSARVALAPTPLAAELLARDADGAMILKREDIVSGLGTLRLARLDLDEGTRAGLQAAGIRTLADCLALPRGAFSRRFGPACLNYLDRLTGRAADPRRRFRAPSHFTGHVELLAEAVHTEALLFAIRRLLLELRGAARGRDAGVDALRLTFEHANIAPTPLRIGLSAVSRDIDHFTTLMRTHLERLILPAPVRALTLQTARFRPLQEPQQRLFGDDDARQTNWHQLVETLRARLGDDAVSAIACADDHRPHRAWHGNPVETAGTAGGAALRADAPRPLWLLPAPRPVDFGNLQLLAGPERIESGWWDGDDLRRDYFLARTSDGARLWVFRTFGAKAGWFVHGIFA